MCDSPPSFCKEKYFNSTAVINDCNYSNEKKVFRNNFFEKIKPIVKSLKNNLKFKKPIMVNQSTSMD